MSDESDFQPGDPIPTEVDVSGAASVDIDAPLRVKARSFAPTLRVPVRGPGQAETVAAVPRGARTAVRGQHNWVPIGPRNVGGRVRALAIEPGDPRVMYAGPASGGVFKSTDGGDSWFPLWHDEPSLSMAALSICAGTPNVVWAATGETQAGGSEVIPPNGVLRSDDRGATWRAPNAGETILGARIHTIAAHPANDQICWAAAAQQDAPDGTEGLYRTTDGGRTWTQFAAGRGFTDVKFATLGGVLRLFVVPQGIVQVAGPPVTNRALVVRVDAPDEPDPAPGLTAALPAFAGPFAPDADPLQLIGSETPAQPAGTTDPARGKLAIYPGGAPGFANPRLYVALTHDDLGDNVTADRAFTAIFRCRNPDVAAPTAMTFTRIPPAPTFGAEGQGLYNLALAVSPTNPNHLAFGMVELYLHRRADANAPAAGDWLRAQMFDLYHLERGHHADHHDLVFAPAPAAPFDNGVAGGALVLWDANDGGVSWCANWLTGAGFQLGAGPDVADATVPLPDDALRWRKRSHGISAAQMYDLTQHPRLPSVLGCGFQDNGVFVGLSGPSWQLVLTADGGFVAFDPDDPYRLYATYQSGVTEARFPGRLRDSLPLPRDRVLEGLWPRELDDGFRPADAALFTAETAFHPTQPGRVLHARRHRLYGTRRTTGDRWIPEPIGTVFEIFHRPAQQAATSSTLEVLDTPGGRAVGLVPQRTVTQRADDANAESRVRSVSTQPYDIGPGMDVRFILENDAPGAAPIPITIPLTIGPNLPASATAAQVASYLTREFPIALAATPAARRPVVDAVTAVLPRTREIVIASTGAGRGQQVVLSGTALAVFGTVARTYHGAAAGAGPGAAAPALPAIAPIMVSAPSAGMDLSGTALRVTREPTVAAPGGANRVDIDFDVELPPPASSHVTIGQLIAVLRRRLPRAAYEVWTSSAFRGLRLTSTAGTNITVDGNLTTVQAGATDTDVALDPANPATTRRLTARDRPATWLDTIDLTALPPPPPGGTDRTLRLREGAPARNTAVQALNLAFVGVTDLTRVTMVELCHAVREMLRTAPTVRIRCDLELSVARDPDEAPAFGEITELAFGPPASRVVYAGDVAGRIYRSTDDGETWVHRPSPSDDRLGECDAIAVQPDHPDTVLVGLYTEGLRNAAAEFLFRSTDGGNTFAVAPAQIDNGLVGAARRVVGVRALVFDPGDPGHVYAATELGVFHSPDAGVSWVAFNEGLPNAWVTDLALATQTRMLRAGVWGRGVHERNLGGRAVHDVLLHLRSTALDDGTGQPSPGPELLAIRPDVARFDASPDIKLFRRDPRVGVLLDGVEFDDELRSGDVRTGPAFVAVQVHNRGAFPTNTARVTALWAPADGGPPPLPPEIWPALANPLAVDSAFGPWRVIGDAAVTGPAGAGHDVVAPGYPRVVVLGAAPNPFAWPAAVDPLRRVGIVAIVRSTDDPLPAAPTGPVDVLALVRGEGLGGAQGASAKIAYREAAVVSAASDDQVLLRATDGSQIAILAVAGAQNAANGGAPFGLSAVALPGAADVRFTTAGPFALPARRRFQVQVQSSATATFAADDPEIANLGRAVAAEVIDVLNRALAAARLPVRAVAMEFGAGADNAIRLRSINTARFSTTGAAATTFGVPVPAAAPVAQRTTPFARRGPWNLTVGAPQSITITATTTVEVRLEPGVDGLPASPVPAADIRASINRQLAQGGLGAVVAEPVVRSLSVRRSATETVGARHVVGGLALADLVAAPAAVLPPARPALFDVVGTHAQDTIAAGANHLYLRSANTGNVSEANVRHRLFLLDTFVAPVTMALLGAAVLAPLAAGASTIVEVVDAVAGVAAGDHRYVLAIADVDAAGLRLDPAPADLATLEALHAFCLRNPAAALREFVVR